VSLKRRPWKLLLLVAFGTAAVILFGIDLLDGEVRLRRLGEVSVAATPGSFVLVIVGYALAVVTVAVGWFVVSAEWGQSYAPPYKPPLVDFDRQRPL
jgi:hypothetical protein